MKKIIILAATFFLLISAKAQQVHFGIKGGLNASELHFSNHAKWDTKIGLHAGFLAHIHASQTWAIQPEIFYSLEGAKTKMISSGTTTINLNYLNVPVLLQYMFDNGFRVEGGPQIGFLISAKTKVNNTSTDNKGFKSTGFSIPLGIGYLTTSGFGFDARYSFGLSNINDDANGPSIQSNVFQFGIFYQFSDTKKHH